MVARADYPFADHYLELDGHHYHYVDEGTGDAVVMVHGNPTWSFYYRRLIAALSDRYRTIAPDHIGCGLSDKPRDRDYDYHFDRRAVDLERLLDHLGIERNITLVVHDWGGMIGLLYAVRHPDRIKKIIVLNTAAFHLPSAKRFPLTLAIGRNTWFGEFMIRGMNLFAWTTSYFGCKRRIMSDHVRDGYLAPYDSWRHRRAVLRFVQDIPLRPQDRGYDLVTRVERDLPRFRSLPIQMHWGLEDFVFDHHFLSRWREILPNAEVYEYEDCGHYILEDAFEEILPRIERFLAEESRATVPEFVGEDDE